MAKARLVFIATWLLLWLSSQLPLLILFSAIGYHGTVVAICETIAAAVAAMITGILMVKEDI
jgi:uncharacterized membrane protein